MNITTIAYALLSGILPALLWLWFWVKENNLHPEPRTTLAKTFVGGAIVVLFAMVFEKFVADVVTDQATLYILWATIEEVLKFLVVALLVLIPRKMDEPIDAMIYCITAALGFAALENTFFIISPLGAGNVIKSIMMGNMRFIGATLVHVVSSASIGFMIGISYNRSLFSKVIAAIIGIAIAIILHSGFNLSIINTSTEGTLKVFGWVWCAVIILLVLFEEIKAIKPKTK